MCQLGSSRQGASWELNLWYSAGWDEEMLAEMTVPMLREVRYPKLENIYTYEVFVGDNSRDSRREELMEFRRDFAGSVGSSVRAGLGRFARSTTRRVSKTGSMRIATWTMKKS